jgi:hypothetical protein
MKITDLSALELRLFISGVIFSSNCLRIIKKSVPLRHQKKQSLIKDMKVYIPVNLVVLHIINVVVVTCMM